MPICCSVTLDPASNAEANMTVNATLFYDAASKLGQICTKVSFRKSPPDMLSKI
jgi:hypothetical protein